MKLNVQAGSSHIWMQLRIPIIELICVDCQKIPLLLPTSYFQFNVFTVTKFLAFETYVETISLQAKRAIMCQRLSLSRSMTISNEFSFMQLVSNMATLKLQVGTALILWRLFVCGVIGRQISKM